MWFDEIDEIFEQMFRTYGFSTGELLAGAREPFTDVIVNDKSGEVVIIAEMPGVANEDIKINAAEDRIEISAGKGAVTLPKTEVTKKTSVKVE